MNIEQKTQAIISFCNRKQRFPQTAKGAIKIALSLLKESQANGYHQDIDLTFLLKAPKLPLFGQKQLRPTFEQKLNACYKFVSRENKWLAAYRRKQERAAFKHFVKSHSILKYTPSWIKEVLYDKRATQEKWRKEDFLKQELAQELLEKVKSYVYREAGKRFPNAAEVSKNIKKKVDIVRTPIPAFDVEKSFYKQKTTIKIQDESYEYHTLNLAYYQPRYYVGLSPDLNQCFIIAPNKNGKYVVTIHNILYLPFMEKATIKTPFGFANAEKGKDIYRHRDYMLKPRHIKKVILKRSNAIKALIDSGQLEFVDDKNYAGSRVVRLCSVRGGDYDVSASLKISDIYSLTSDINRFLANLTELKKTRDKLEEDYQQVKYPLYLPFAPFVEGTNCSYGVRTMWERLRDEYAKELKARFPNAEVSTFSELSSISFELHWGIRTSFRYMSLTTLMADRVIRRVTDATIKERERFFTNENGQNILNAFKGYSPSE